MTQVALRRCIAGLFVSSIVLAACRGPAAPVIAPATVTSASTVAASSTVTLPPSATSAPSDTPAATNTTAPSATPTLQPPTPTDSPTPPPPTATRSPTARPTATRTKAPPPPPTATAAPTDTSVPANTGGEPFSSNSFKNALNRVHIAMQDFIQQLGLADSSGVANCTALVGDYGQWIGASDYSGVPAPWVPLHTEYRSAIQEAVTGAQPVENICNHGGGYIPHDQYLKILAQIDDAQNRIFAVQNHAKGMG